MLPPQALAHKFLKDDSIFQAFKGFQSDGAKTNDALQNGQSPGQIVQPHSFQRERFYSTNNDQMLRHEKHSNGFSPSIENLSQSNQSTNFTCVSDPEKFNQELRKDRQKMREKQVVDFVSQIWKEMNVTYQQIHGQETQ